MSAVMQAALEAAIAKGANVEEQLERLANRVQQLHEENGRLRRKLARVQDAADDSPGHGMAGGMPDGGLAVPAGGHAMCNEADRPRDERRGAC